MRRKWLASHDGSSSANNNRRLVPRLTTSESVTSRIAQQRAERLGNLRIAAPCLLSLAIAQLLPCSHAQEVVVTHGDSVTLSPQTFSTTVPGPAGTVLYATGTNPTTGAPSTIIGNSLNIFTIGNQAYGVDAENGAYIDLAGSSSTGIFTISTSGNNASGIVAKGAGTLVEATSPRLE